MNFMNFYYLIFNNAMLGLKALIFVLINFTKVNYFIIMTEKVEFIAEVSKYFILMLVMNFVYN